MRVRLCNQRGSALALALFILVVMSLLSVTLLRLLDSSNESITVEVYGTRALLAATSGIDQMAAVIFPLNTTATSPDQLQSLRCADVTNPLQTTLPNTVGLGTANCSVTVSCDDTEFTVAGETVVYYRLTSVGVCNAGDWQTSRQVQVEAKAL